MSARREKQEMSEGRLKSSPTAARGVIDPSDDLTTVVAVGVAAATLAAVCHETLGHGLGCIVDGGRITLLTSIYVRCGGTTAPAGWVAAGPAGNFLAGAVAFAFLAFRRTGRAAGLFLVLFGAFNWFWLFGQMADGALLSVDDWGFIAQQMGWSWIWRPIVGAIGVAGYATTIRLSVVALTRTGAPGRRPLQLAYVAGAVSTVIAA